MATGTAHVVLGLMDCIIEGGHFYLSQWLSRTLAARLNEHFFGKTNTNTVHVACEFILHGGLKYYHNALVGMW